MRRTVLITAVFLLICSLAVGLYAQAVKCPIDDSGAYFTGKVKSEAGKVLWLYKCAGFGHEFWVVQNAK